jgi:hypothetical protein
MRCLMGVELQDVELSSIMKRTVAGFEHLEAEAGKRGDSSVTGESVM